MYIDKLPCLRVRHLKAFTKVLNKIEEADAQGYCTRLKPGANEIASGGFTLAGLQYSCKLLCKELDFYSLLLKWKDQEGTPRSERIYLELRESKLGRGVFFFFICPYSGKLSTKLLADSRGYLASRSQYEKLGLHYTTQMEKGGRAKVRPKAITIGHTISLIRLEDRDPYRKRGKVHYRGRPTPYGKRLEKYEQKHAELEQESLKDMPYLVNECGVDVPLLLGWSRG